MLITFVDILSEENMKYYGFDMKKIFKLFALISLTVSLNSCVWLAIAGIGAAGGATGAYMVDKDK